MFTGIIETAARIVSIAPQGSGLELCMHCPQLIQELKVDQSIAHNGVCLTVTTLHADTYTVTAVEETLKKTNFSKLKAGDLVNLERSMQMNGRLDGHIVQGHVDQTATCMDIQNKQGSWEFYFRYKSSDNVTVEKGSICVNGISLTVVKSLADEFSVAIIPYTYENTNLHLLKPGDLVNIEFDIIGKYLTKLIKNYNLPNHK